MEEWERMVDQANKEQIEQMLQDVLGRYEKLFPEWQICTVSIHSRDDREKQIDSMIEMLQKVKTIS